MNLTEVLEAWQSGRPAALDRLARLSELLAAIYDSQGRASVRDRKVGAAADFFERRTYLQDLARQLRQIAERRQSAPWDQFEDWEELGPLADDLLGPFVARGSDLMAALAFDIRRIRWAADPVAWSGPPIADQLERALFDLEANTSRP